jgi:hypothetical protein
MRRISVALTFLVLAACGGGGGGGGDATSPSGHTPVNFGLVPAVSTRTIAAIVHNGTGAAATLKVVSTSGSFAIAPGALPVAVAKDADTSVSVIVSPAGAGGVLSGSIKLHFTGGAGDDVILDCTATSEVIDLGTTTPTLAFGEVPAGMKKDMSVAIQNHGLITTAHVTGVQLPAGGFSLLSTLPISIAPSASANVSIRYAPLVPSAPSGTVVITTDDPDGAISIPVAATSGGQTVTDFGSMTFTNGFTAPFSISIPTDAISFTISAVTSPGTQVGLGLLTGPQGQVYENESATGAYLQYPDDEIFDAIVPNTDKASLALIPGTWTVKLRRFSGSATSANARLTVQRRPGPTTGVGTLDLNIFLANVITPKAATAALDANMQDVLARVDTIYSQQGIRLGKVDYYDVTDSTYDDVTNAEFPGLLKLSSAATKTRLDFFFVRTAVGGGVIGEAAKIDGPAQNGTWASGVMGIWIDSPSASQRDLLARVMAHEIGHYLGLLHTAEQGGTAHDQIDDTADCGDSGCGIASQLYLMHWNASPGGAVITNGEGLVVRGHPLIAAALPPGVVLPAMIARYPDSPLEVWPNWCGTCRRTK